MRRFLAAALLLLSLAGQKMAAAEQYWFNHYLTTDGLPSNTIYAVVQDKYNFIWIGTRDGICRFDGHNFVKLGSDAPNSVTSGMTPALCMDDSGVLWFANGNGAGSYDIDTGETTSLGMLDENDVRQICQDKAGNIWFLAANLYRYNRRSGVVSKYTTAELPGPEYIASDPLGTVWITSGAGNLYRYDSRTDNFERQEPAGLGRIVSTGRGMLLAATTDNNVVLLDPETGSSRTIFHYDSPRSILSLMERVPGEYWIGTETGVYVVSDRDGSAVLIQESATDPHAISASYVMSMTTDSEGNVWAGTFYKGLNLWLNKRDSYQLYYDNEAKGSIKGNIVRSICPAPSGGLWIGTEDGFLNFFDPSTHEFEQFSDPAQPFINVQDVMRVGRELWIATYGAGLFRFRPDLRKNVAHYVFPNDLIIRQRQLKDGRIIVGSHEGLFLYDEDSDSFVKVDVLGDHFVHALFQDSRENVWIGTYGSGIWLLDKNLKLIRRINVQNSGNGLRSNHITSFLEDSGNRIWITTEGGGITSTSADWTPDNLGLTQYDKRDGLPSNVACAIAEDLNGHLWVSTTHGLSQFDTENHRFSTSYFEESHVTTSQYSYGASYTAANGTIYMGSTDGMIAFSPALLESLASNKNLMISGITARTSRNTLQLSSPGHSYYTSDRIKVGFRDISSLEVTFAAPNYSSILSTEYEYTLKHRRKTLSGTTVDGKANFTGIGPGKYVLNANIVGEDSPEAHKTLEIKVTPPLYATLLAKILYVLLAIGLLSFVWNAIIRRRRTERESQLERMENDKQKEIYDAKIKYFTNLTHEIRTPLSLIKMPVDKIIASGGYKESAKEDMLTIQANTSRLLDLTNQLLDLRKMEQKELKLNFTEEDIKDILHKSCEYFTASTQERHITMNVDVPDGPVPVVCAADSIEKIFTNLISNAIKYGKDRIDISLTENALRDRVIVRVDSNGTPIDEKDREKIFEPFYQVKMANDQIAGSKGTGLGLPFARTLAEMHNGRLYIDSTRKDVNSFVLDIPKDQPRNVSIKSTPVQTEADMLPSEIDNSRHTILVVEDSAEMRYYLGKELSDEYNTLLASNGEEAIKVVQGQKVDLVISDIMMPVMDGCELCNRIKSDVEFCHIPVILLTAAVGVETRIETLRVGADGYIEKPFSIDLLKANVSNLFKNKEIAFKQFTESPLSHYNSVTVGSVDNEFMEKLHAEVMKHLSEQDLNIEALTSILGTSKSTLYRKIKANTGLNINEYIRLCRLKEAAEMLSSQKYRINEVAYLVGFSSPSYFTTSFQKQFNISPSAFVKRIRQEEP
ncbi:MAG: response regulator [Bacteroidales bacterium]|nr:response regulator [Bacteroidales bacterium]